MSDSYWETLTDTVEALGAKVQACVIENNPEAARTYASALQDTCSGMRDIMEGQAASQNGTGEEEAE